MNRVEELEEARKWTYLDTAIPLSKMKYFKMYNRKEDTNLKENGVEYKEGFYYLKNPNETEPTLVHGYYCTDLDGAFVFGFNTHDGGGLLPLSDLTTDTEVVPVEINESKL